MDAWASEFSRWFLAGFFTFVAVFYTVKILAVRRRTGTSPVELGVRGSPSWRIYALFRVFRALILLVCIARLVWPGLDQFLIPIRPLWSWQLLLVGNGLLAVSLSLILAVHVYMAAEWRSGIPSGRGTRLVTDGPYAVTRNPMAILIQLGQVGLFLSLPTAFTLICLLVGIVAMHRHVRLEEAALEGLHGDDYRAYRNRVPRWLALRTLRPAGSARTRSTGHGRAARPARPEDPDPRPG